MSFLKEMSHPSLTFPQIVLCNINPLSYCTLMLNKMFLSRLTKPGKIWVVLCVISSSYRSSFSLLHPPFLSLTPFPTIHVYIYSSPHLSPPPPVPQFMCLSISPSDPICPALPQMNHKLWVVSLYLKPSDARNEKFCSVFCGRIEAVYLFCHK